MCTSIKMQSTDGSLLLARTMDWHTFPAKPISLPRNYQWLGVCQNQVFANKYAILGVGHDIENIHADLSDGINELGLAGQKLTFSNASVYSQTINPQLKQLAPFEFVLWVLGNFKSVAEIIENIAQIQLMTDINATFKFGRNDLHFAFADKTGAMINIEPLAGRLEVKVNQIGLLTNAPNFEREITKLNQYMDFSSPATNLNQISSGNFSGKLGLPGGFTPTARFIRATLLKEYAITPADEAANLIETWHILNSVTVPRSAQRSTTYTIYRCAYSLNNRSLYYQAYDDLNVSSYTFI